MSEPNANKKLSAWLVTYRQSARNARARRWIVIAATREAAQQAASQTLRALDPKGRVLAIDLKGGPECLS